MAQALDNQRTPTGQFKKGHVRIAARAKGTPNKMSRSVRDAVIEACVAHGANGEGDGGLQGCMDWLLRNHTKAFVPLLVRLLPLQVSATHNHTKKLNVNVMMVPRGTFLTEAQARAVQAGAPLDLDTLCIDVSPTPTVNDAPPMERATADEAAE